MHHINDTLKEFRCSSKSQVQQATRCKDAITARITAYVIIIFAISMNHAIVTNTVITTIFTIIIAMCAVSNAMSAMLAMITTTRIVRLIAICDHKDCKYNHHDCNCKRDCYGSGNHTNKDHHTIHIDAGHKMNRSPSWGSSTSSKSSKYSRHSSSAAYAFRNRSKSGEKHHIADQGCKGPQSPKYSVPQKDSLLLWRIMRALSH